MVDKDVADIFEKWNPMKAVYQNVSLNKYNTGPGAALEPGTAFKKHLDREQVPYLYIKNVPEHLEEEGLYNLCSQYGHIVGIRKRDKSYFMDLANLGDMDAIYHVLKKKIKGITVEIGKNCKRQSQPNEQIQQQNDQTEMENFDNDNSEIEPITAPPNEKRILDGIPTKNHAPPFFHDTPFITTNDYDSKDNFLAKVDPKKQYVNVEDTYSLERLGHIEKTEFLNNSNYEFATGRAYIKIDDATKQLMSAKAVNTNNDDISELHIGKCDNCSLLCSHICNDCETFYCSKQCQIKKWKTHRYVCGKPKHMQRTELSDSENSLSSSTLSVVRDHMPQSGDVVMITSISKSNLVFVRSAHAEEYLSFFKIMQKVYSAGANGKQLTDIPKLGQVVITKSKDQYNRAMVLNIDDPNSIKVVYIDFGNVEYKQLSELYLATNELISEPRFANPVLLKGVPYRYMTTKIRDYMFSWLNMDAIIIYNPVDEENGVQSVELKHFVSNKTLNSAVISLCLSNERPKDEVLFINFLEHIKLPTGNNIEVVIMDNSFLITGIVSCTTRAYAIEITKFQKELQTFGESSKEMLYAPRVNELCLARYGKDNSKKWFRGFCVEIVGDGKPCILFMDYGFSANINIEDIRPYPNQYTFPKLTSECDIKGLPQILENMESKEKRENLIATLETLLPVGSVIKCDHIEYNEKLNFCELTLHKIKQQLEMDGLLKEA
ncbi:protein vreteno [Teleopsis dalmanni]|uniref:protein vreteno n=1 Tax=Teleopsis dalmanni TaxID=139649 RepID=UPI0018CD6CE7|nr:protein vreteno [Teleopsis dalmanni]